MQPFVKLRRAQPAPVPVAIELDDPIVRALGSMFSLLPFALRLDLMRTASSDPALSRAKFAIEKKKKKPADVLGIEILLAFSIYMEIVTDLKRARNDQLRSSCNGLTHLILYSEC